MELVVSVRERVEQMEWRERRESQVESGGARTSSVEGGVSGESGGERSKLERKEIGGVGVASGERVRESGSRGEGGEGSGVRQVDVFGLKCRPTTLLSLQPPKFSKDKPARQNLHSSARKRNLHKPSESQISSTLQFWEKWGMVKTGSNTTSVLTKGQDVSGIGVKF